MRHGRTVTKCARETIDGRNASPRGSFISSKGIRVVFRFRNPERHDGRPRRGAPGPRHARCRCPRRTSSTATRCAARTPTAETAMFGLGLLLGRRAQVLAGAGRVDDRGRLRRRLHAQPDLRGGVLRPHRPHRGRARGLRPGRSYLRRAAAASSGRATTRPRACARATTSARSTAPASTLLRRRSSARGRGVARRVPGARWTAAGYGEITTEIVPARPSSTSPRTTTSSTSPRTPAATAASAAPASAARSASPASSCGRRRTRVSARVYQRFEHGDVVHESRPRSRTRGPAHRGRGRATSRRSAASARPARGRARSPAPSPARAARSSRPSGGADHGVVLGLLRVLAMEPDLEREDAGPGTSRAPTTCAS